MTTEAQRVLIVNADDFGQSFGVNRGIIQAHEHGIVTSSSLMVRWPAAHEAAQYARGRSRLSVGLHVDLGEWMYRDGAWVPLYEVVSLNEAALIADEIDRQLEAFTELMGREPTHIDSHQHVHLRSPAREVITAFAARLGVPLRSVTRAIRFCGNFYGQTAEGVRLPDALTADRLIALLRALPPGVTELSCHPGFDDDGLMTMYRAERVEEVAVLCDRRVRDAAAELDIALRSFAEVGGEAAFRS